MLRNFVRGEFEVFLLFLKVICDVKFNEAMGHAYAQGLHDGGTLASKRKYQVLALQFIAPKFKKNLLSSHAPKHMSRHRIANSSNI